MPDFKLPLIVRGEVIEDYEVEFSDRSAEGRSFVTPSVARHIHQLVSKSPAILSDLYTINFEEILDYLDELSGLLNLDRNPHWREAFEVSCHSSNISRPVLEAVYRRSPETLRRASVRQVAEARIGVPYLEGWVRTQLINGASMDVRAMGARSAHIIAGNVPITAIITLLRSAITRNDAIVKAPSNDPLTMSAIARTMIEMAPNHPLTRHLSVGYWKGGDEAVEEKIYQPRHIEKLVAWGGFASIKHITKYLQPGIDLITLDPKSSSTMIGRAALKDEPTMREVARRAATDLGALDQEACVNARVIFLESGAGPDGIALANRFGEMMFEALQALPKTTSAGPNAFDPALKTEILSIAQQDDFFRVYTRKGEMERTGAIIVSQFDEQVDFPALLYGRVGNIVPLDNIERAMDYFSAATQTVGVYPDELRTKIRDHATLMGAQRLVSLGYAVGGMTAAPQDGIEPERRMCRWVVDGLTDPSIVRGAWVRDEERTPAEASA
jgi:hypothetical protein